MDNGGRILLQRSGTSQEGSTNPTLQPFSMFTSSTYTTCKKPTLQSLLSLPLPTTSSSSSSFTKHPNKEACVLKSTVKIVDCMGEKQLQRLAFLEAHGISRRFTQHELICATNNFSLQMVIGEGRQSKVYKANFGGRAAAVKVLKMTLSSGDDLLQEVEILSSLNHENIVQIIGYCYSKEIHAVVYDLLQESLKHKLRKLGWNERLEVAVGVAEALEHLHHSCSPPIIHRDVKSSNILLSHHCQPQLSDFGAAIVHHQHQRFSPNMKPFQIVGTFGYLAPEYVMYGKVDEKTDVYSFGVVLLELITGKEAIQTSQESNRESLVLWARSLFSNGLCERLIDPYLNEDYDREEMQRMMTAARLCLMHSSSRRPTLKIVCGFIF